MLNISRLPIALVLVLFAIVSGRYAVTTPLFEASDELWHYPVVWRLARGEGMPVLDANHPGPWRSHCPPHDCACVSPWWHNEGSNR